MANRTRSVVGGRNEVLAQPLVGYSTESARRALPKCENKREIKGEIRAVLRLVSFVLFTVKKKNLRYSQERRKKKES